MILYIIYNADLLEMLVLLLEEDSVRYIDDAITIAFSKDFHEMTQALKCMMEREDGGLTWSSTHNSRFEISKLAILHTSRRTQKDLENLRKRVSMDRPLLQLQGKTVKEVKSYKHLGVHINVQLQWTVQAQKGVANTTNWVMQFHRLTRLSTGHSVKLMHQLYISVAIPKITYALDIWYTPPTKPLSHRRSVGPVGILRQIVKLQRMVSLSIVGGMKSTSTDLLDAHTGLLPMELTLLHICHRATVRLCSLPLLHPLYAMVHAAHLSTNEKHSDLIRNALKIFELNPQKFETIRPDTTPPAYYKHVKATILREQKVTIKVEAKDEADYKIYTDGSIHDGRVGASAIILCKGTSRAERSLTYHLGNSSKYTIADTELVDALIGIWLLHTTPGTARGNTSLYTNSQTAVHHLTKRYTGPGSHIINAFKGYINHALKINWIPGHSNIPGNIKANDLAHLAAQGQSSPIDSLPPLLR